MSSFERSSMTNRCLESNNKGIELLKGGEIEQAMAAFVDALAAARDSLRLLGMDEVMDAMELASAIKYRPNFRIDREKIILGDGESPHPHSDLYSHAFLFSKDWFESLNYSKMLTISVAAVFNLALTHHFRGLASHSIQQRKARYQQAIHLYELAHSMQKEGTTLFSLEFSCAIACNLGNIHRLLGDETRSNRCFQHLHMLVMYAQNAENGAEKLSPEAADAFTTCVCTLLMAPSTAPAA